MLSNENISSFVVRQTSHCKSKPLRKVQATWIIGSGPGRSRGAELEKISKRVCRKQMHTHTHTHTHTHMNMMVGRISANQSQLIGQSHRSCSWHCIYIYIYMSHMGKIYIHILEQEMATHCSILAWRIPWTEKPGRLQTMGLQRVGHSKAIYIYVCVYVCIDRQMMSADLLIFLPTIFLYFLRQHWSQSPPASLGACGIQTAVALSQYKLWWPRMCDLSDPGCQLP